METEGTGVSRSLDATLGMERASAACGQPCVFKSVWTNCTINGAVMLGGDISFVGSSISLTLMVRLMANGQLVDDELFLEDEDDSNAFY